MEKREKIFVVLITVLILLGIFIAFIISNSQKTPPEVLVQNENRKIVSATLGGYTWKVFGTNILADSVDLKTVDFSSKNTIVSKTGEALTLSTTEKFSVQNVSYYKKLSEEMIETTARNNETGNYFTINAPELEGTYICLFNLDYYNKGTAEYAVKIVVTDEDIYDIDNIIEYKNTDLLNLENVKNIIKKLSYAEKYKGIIINSINSSKNIKINYENIDVEKSDLFNNSVALFALIPNLNSVTYDVNSLKEDIFFTREEINNSIGRNVLEYVENIELWNKEIIYKEKITEYTNEVAIYTSAISTALANLNENDIGEYIAIDLSENNTSGEVSLNEFELNNVLDELSKEYNCILNVNKDEFINKNGTLVIVKISNNDVNSYIIDVEINVSNNQTLEYSYIAFVDGNSVSIINNELILENDIVEE